MNVVNVKNAFDDINNLPFEESQFPEIVNQAIAIFNEIYQSAPQKVKDLSSYDFSLIVGRAELFLLIAAKFAKNNPGFEQQIIKTKKQFNELIRMMPEGPCILLRQNLDSLKKLNEVPINEKYKTKLGDEYYEPKTCVFDIVSYFEKFKHENELGSITVVMKTNQFYGSYGDKMMTTIGFRKNEDFTHKLKKIKRMKVDLETFASQKIKEWRYSYFEVIIPSEVDDDVKLRMGKDNQYVIYVIFFHKKVEKQEDNLMEFPKNEFNKNMPINPEALQEPIEKIESIVKPNNDAPPVTPKKKKGLILRCLKNLRKFFAFLLKCFCCFKKSSR